MAWFNQKEKDREMSESTSIEFLNGNRNTPVLNLGDDPSNKDAEGNKVADNVLIVPLGSAVSVPRNTVSKTEGTPEPSKG